jgi:hypothetical protein
MDTALGPKTGFYRSIAHEHWRALPRQPEVQIAVGVLCTAIFIIVVSGVLIWKSGEAFAEILFGFGCLGWSINQLWLRMPAFRAWRAIGTVELVAHGIDMRLGEPWACAIRITPRRAHEIATCTLTAWTSDSRHAKNGAPTGNAWAVDVPIAPVDPPVGAITQYDAVVELPLPPDAAPSYFGAFTRRWTITAELTTVSGARWRRDYPVLVFPPVGWRGSLITGAVEEEPDVDAEAAATDS